MSDHLISTRLLGASLALAVAAGSAAACGGGSKKAQPVAAPTATTATSAGASAGAPLSEQDQGWMEAMREGGLTEIQAGKLAQQKGTEADVRRLGAMLVEDHTAFDRKLAALAQKLGVELPNSPSQEQLLEAGRLQAGSGASFDKDWLNAMLKGHDDAIALGQAEMQEGSSQQVVDLAREAAPVLQKHRDALEKAQQG